MATHTCLGCHVAFNSYEGQRDHFQSDWHRYNAMRKVAELPPVSKETYNERVGLIKSQKQAEEEIDGKIHCQPCKKSFTSQKAFDNHTKSKKHLDTVIKYQQGASEADLNKKNKQLSATVQAVSDDEDNMEVEEVDDDEWEGEAIPITDCLICSHHSSTLEKNLQHMTSSHSFFIPDLEYCIDAVKLVEYLGEKVGCGYECLACNWKASRSYTLDSVQKHMVSKGHCFVRLEGDGLIEYADFYDYSSSYPDADEGEGNPDEEVELNQIGVSEVYQLVLPSGATIGHRSLKRYYRQSLDPNRSAVAVRSNGSMFHKIMSHYRALGYHGSTSQDAVVKHRDIKFMRRMQNKNYMKVGIKANKFQFHFRNQNPM